MNSDQRVTERNRIDFGRWKMLSLRVTWRIVIISIAFWNRGFLISAAIAESPTDIYQRRILPLLRSPQSSSCSECHLQGIDLKKILFEDPQRTFTELRARGWIDIDDPENSKLLKFIAKQPADSGDLQRKVREVELGAIRAWIQAAVKAPSMLAAPLPKLDDLSIDVALVRHTRAEQITHRFVAAIWSQLERCANCHSPDRNQKQIDEHGDSMSWIVPKSPDKTLQLLLDRNLIDLEYPERSVLRVKSIGEASHGGGIKFPSGGKTDQAWLDFLNDFAKTKKAEYRSSADIPSKPMPTGWRSGLHFRITNFPSNWTGRLLYVTFHRQLPDGTYAANPSAWAEGRVSSERLRWGNSLSLLGDPSALSKDISPPIELDEALPEGLYQGRMTALAPRFDAGQRQPPAGSMGVFEIKAPWLAGHSQGQQIEFSSIQRK